MGVMTEEVFHTDNQLGLGILGVFDPAGGYGAGVTSDIF
jgi:hypothetical protein